MRTILINFRKSPPTPPRVPKDKEDIVVENVPTKDDNIEPQVGHIKNPEITEGRKILAIKQMQAFVPSKAEQTLNKAFDHRARAT